MSLHGENESLRAGSTWLGEGEAGGRLAGPVPTESAHLEQETCPGGGEQSPKAKKGDFHFCSKARLESNLHSVSVTLFCTVL